MEDYSEIINKARELAELIREHPITTRYRETSDRMKNDVSAQRLLEKLVMLGRDLNEQILKGEVAKAGGAELELLKIEFEKNALVKEHLLAQKEYLDLLKNIQEHIKNPIL